MYSYKIYSNFHLIDTLLYLYLHTILQLNSMFLKPAFQFSHQLECFQLLALPSFKMIDPCPAVLSVMPLCRWDNVALQPHHHR